MPMNRINITGAICVLAAACAAVALPSQAQTFQPGVSITDNNPYPVKIAAPMRATSTVTSGTIAATNTYQSVLAANAARKGCTIQNKSVGVMRVFLGAPGSASDATSFDLAAGSTFSCNAGSLVLVDEISLSSATAGGPFVVSRQ